MGPTSVFFNLQTVVIKLSGFENRNKLLRGWGKGSKVTPRIALLPGSREDFYLLKPAPVTLGGEGALPPLQSSPSFQMCKTQYHNSGFFDRKPEVGSNHNVYTFGGFGSPAQGSVGLPAPHGGQG